MCGLTAANIALRYDMACKQAEVDSASTREKVEEALQRFGTQIFPNPTGGPGQVDARSYRVATATNPYLERISTTVVIVEGLLSGLDNLFGVVGSVFIVHCFTGNVFLLLDHGDVARNFGQKGLMEIKYHLPQSYCWVIKDTCAYTDGMQEHPFTWQDAVALGKTIDGLVQGS
jgi:hypothetical protein